MVLIVFFVFLTLSFCSFFPIRNKNLELLLLLFFALVLIAFAGLRPEGIDRDYLNYKEIFLYLSENSTYLVEYGFVLITKVIHLFSGSYFVLFFVFASFSVIVKTYSIYKLSDYVFISFLIYFSNTYILQEFTQIRAGLASGLVLLSIIPLQAKRHVQFFIIAAIAVLFHFSALVLFFIWFLNPEKINKYFWAAIIPLSYLILFIGLSPINLYKLIPIEAIQAKLDTYILLQEVDSEEKVNVLSTLVLLRTIMTMYLLWNSNKIQEINKYAILLIKIYITSIVVLIVASSTSAIALRLSEFFVVAEIVALPLVIDTINPRYRIFARIIVILFSAVLLFFHFRAKTLLIF
jgi:hypothetical protein